jgi:hypothetical protein
VVLILNFVQVRRVNYNGHLIPMQLDAFALSVGTT